MAKERLDLMVDGKVKRMLRNVAASEGISMSQLVEVMLTEHLSADGGPAGPTQAVADLLWIQRLQGEFEQAMELGRIHSFRNWVGVNSRKVPSEGDEPVILFVGKGEDGYYKGDVVVDWYADGDDVGILSTYDSVLKTVCVRMEWTVDEDGSFVPCGFLVWPKEGGDRIQDPLFEWRCPTKWRARAYSEVAVDRQLDVDGSTFGSTKDEITE